MNRKRIEFWTQWCYLKGRTNFWKKKSFWFTPTCIWTSIRSRRFSVLYNDGIEIVLELLCEILTRWFRAFSRDVFDIIFELPSKLLLGFPSRCYRHRSRDLIDMIFDQLLEVQLNSLPAVSRHAIKTLSRYFSISDLRWQSSQLIFFVIWINLICL